SRPGPRRSKPTSRSRRWITWSRAWAGRPTRRARVGIGVTIGALSPATEKSPEAEAQAAASAEGRRAARRRAIESVAIPLGAIAAALVVFGIFVALTGRNALAVYHEMYRGSFGTWFSFQNTLQRAAPIMLSALATAAIGIHLHSPFSVKLAMFVTGALVGGLWSAGAGALRAYRGVNETISTLLLNYIAIALLNHLVEGPLRDPASLNKPSTFPIGDDNMLGNLPGLDVHWGLGFGLIACLIAWFLMQRTTFGFSARMVGGNVRAALLNGLPVRRLIVVATFLGGLGAGLAGAVEVAAIHGNANAALVTGYGYTGVLVAFIAHAN